MRHRIVSGTGFGNPDPVILNNTGNLNKEFAQAALNAYFGKFEYFDFHIDTNEVTVGVEPAYQYENLNIISINKDKNKSYTKSGKAWGPYGSGIVSNTKTYGQYKRKCKFTKFVDQWHPILFGVQ